MCRLDTSSQQPGSSRKGTENHEARKLSPSAGVVKGTSALIYTRRLLPFFLINTPNHLLRKKKKDFDSSVQGLELPCCLLSPGTRSSGTHVTAAIIMSAFVWLRVEREA
ncbi:unnamed protein product [Rangifer tarandus platyrhynchus]|uniref:Uncharacterized protein n=1 Tax=Rangifer tarandus platyrhynchus TaxID=3082113 RepID=A0AC59YIB0_RANTA